MNRNLLQLILIIAACVFNIQSWAQQTLLPLPPHQSVYTMSNAIRGYYFVAPVNFTITGARVPSEAGTGLQNIHIVKLPAAPPTFATTTTVYTTAFNVTGAPNGVIQTMNIPVTAGEVIGVLGNSTWGHSYGPTAPTVNWFGQNVTLYRFGSQTYPTADVWTEASSIARVELYVTTCQSYLINNNQTICQGQSVSVGNKTYNTTGVYTDSFKTVDDCDSVIVTNLTVNPVYTTEFSDSIYFGQQYAFNGFNYGASGRYRANYSSIHGCDSSTYLNLKVIPFTNDTFRYAICAGDTAIHENYLFHRPGVYRDTVIASWGHTFRTFIITQNPNPNPRLMTKGPMDDLCIGDSISLYLSGADTFRWYYKETPFNREFFVGDTLNTKVFDFETEYIIEAITDKNCSITQSLTVIGKNCCELFIPNAFTPNDDGLNDYFEVRGHQPLVYNLQIFNRYGKRVFNAEKIDAQWNGTEYNGKPLSSDVYYYHITGKCYDGSTIDKRGSITIIR